MKNFKVKLYKEKDNKFAKSIIITAKNLIDAYDKIKNNHFCKNLNIPKEWRFEIPYIEEI